jgi:hypothetical protein
MSQKKWMISFLLIVFFACDNQQKISKSKNNSNGESQLIEQTKDDFSKSIDSLNEDISSLEKSKNRLAANLDYSLSNVYSYLNNSFLDHIIIGTKNLEETKLFLENSLGFKIKTGNIHKNGIKNIFVEFEDSSEIEFVSVQNPTDQLASDYNKLINKNHFGLQFAVRTNHITELYSHLQKVNSDFNNFSNNKIYSSISQSNISSQKPFFIIQYHNKMNNSTNYHQGKINGLSAIWLTTPNLIETIKTYSEYGFTLVDTVTVANIKNKTATMKNKNFEIILIADNSYSILGLTLRSESIDEVQKMFAKNFNKAVDIKKSKRGKSIYLPPQVTKSIWFEFIEVY